MAIEKIDHCQTKTQMVQEIKFKLEIQIMQYFLLTHCEIVKDANFKQNRKLTTKLKSSYISDLIFKIYKNINRSKNKNFIPKFRFPENVYF